ncbi:MAG: phenylalanine--tRNA ligase subunit beta, partial [Thermodesulfobacteriota bacterium]
MIFNYSWLTEFVDIDITSPAELAERLTMSGVEVEGMTSPRHEFTGIVTATILTKEQHPNADRLKLLTVTDGEERYSIVCGADNMNVGDVVALARIGAVLPPPSEMKIKRSK